MSEEKIKLSLDYGTSAKDTVDISGKLDMLKNAAKNVGGDAFGELVSKSIEVGKGFAGISWAADKTEKDTKLSFGELKEHGKSLFEAFGEQNAGGMIKSIAGIASLVPAFAPFAAGIAAAGEAAATAWPIVKEWAKYIGEANKSFLEATTGIDKYVAKLKEANTALKETDALKKLREEDKAETPDAKKKDRAETLEFLMKGRGESSLEEITEALDPEASVREAKIDDIKKRLNARLKEIKERGVSQPEPVNQAMRYQANIEAREAMAKIGNNEDAQSKAEKLIEKARTGDAGAIAELLKLLPKDSTTREIVRMASPQAQEEAAEEKRYLAEQQRQRTEQMEFERSHPEIGQQREEQRRQDQRRFEHEGLKDAGFQSLPELGAPQEAPVRGPSRRDDIGPAIRPVQALQGKTLGVMGKLAEDMAAIAGQQQAQLDRIENLQRNTRSSISKDRTKQSDGGF